MAARLTKEEPRIVPRHQMGEWRKLANCRGIDPDLMYPGQGESAAAAKQVCAGCVVAWDCLEHAMLASEKFGVWGRVGERTRRHLRVWLAKHPGSTLLDALRALNVTEWREATQSVLDEAPEHVVA